MSNGFTDEQTALIERVAIEVADKMASRMEKWVQDQISLHSWKCPGRAGWRAVVVIAAVLVTLANIGIAIFK